MSKPTPSTESATIGERVQLRAFVTDEETKKSVEQVVGDLMIPNAIIQRGDVQTAIAALGESRSPRILLVDISGTDMPLSAVNQLAEVCEPGVTVITVGDRNDVGLFRELITHGVSDYIVKPLTAALLQKSLLGTVDSQSAPRQTSRLGRLVTVMAARGGAGATMVAGGLAWSIANHRRRRVALFDLDLHFGSAALGLDLDPCRGLREALESPSRIDSLYVERTLVRHSDTLYVLGAEEALDDLVFTDKEALAVLLTELRTKFHFVVADLPRQMTSSTQLLLTTASNLVVVTDMSLVGMRDTMRILQLMPTVNASCTVTIVANRVGEHREGEISKAEFEKGIGKPIDMVVPFDRAHVFATMNAGKPVAAGKDKVASSLRALAEQISGGSARPAATGMFKRLMRRRA